MGRPKQTKGRPRYDLSGLKFSRLTVVGVDDNAYYRSPKGSPKILWKCLCDCGNTITTSSENLKTNKVVDCGCSKHTALYEYGSSDYYRNSNLLGKYGITLVEWDALFLEQGCRCKLCGTTEPRGKNWHTDHAHTTNEVRGILCGWCNTALGKFQESPEILAKAIEYTTRHKDKNGVEDIKKAIHYLQLILELQYGG